VDVSVALNNARSAHGDWSRAHEHAEGLRALRNLAILEAHDAGATQAEIARALELSQQAVSSILTRTERAIG
jgi:DNA-binding NarL/FixJ family response regulator